MRRTLALGLLASIFTLACPETAHAESIINNPGDHPSYKVELEPQLVLGWSHLWIGNGFGLGLRASIPIVENGFVKSINNSVAISFGFDWLRYGDCYYVNARFGSYGCGASYFIFPVAMQWNFWLSPNWSVFGEPGLYIYHGVFDNYCNDPRFVGYGCGYPTATGVDFAFFAGGRFHFNETVSLTMRIGYPTASFGVSIFL
jgi:hypothetical protein